MSENVSKSICLKELIQKSDLIVVAHKEDSAVFTEETYIISEKKSPPFTSRFYLFSFLDIIYSKQETNAKETNIKVYCADDSLHQRMYENYIKGGIKSSIETAFYQSCIRFENSSDFILFLKKETHPPKYSFTVNGGYEDPGKICDIKRILETL